MNIGVVSCLVLGGIFTALGLLFWALGDRGAMLISGFNTLPREEREAYDWARMSRDQRRQFFSWAVVFLAGAGASWLWGAWAALAAFFLWLVLFFREVHLDPDRAFEKYRKQQ